jgi:G3E family GTPase
VSDSSGAARRPRVTVLAGFSSAATAAVGRSLLVTDPRLVLVSHDMRRIREGVVHRTVRTADAVLESDTVELVHGCVSCTLREDVLPTLVRLARRRPGSGILLALPPAVEPEAVAAACAHCLVDGVLVTDAVRFGSFVTVVEAAALLDDLGSTDELRDRDLHAAENDFRGVADVVARQIEYADTIVIWGRPRHDESDDAPLAALLHRLAPWATHVRAADSYTIDCTALAARLLHSGRHDPGTPGTLGRALAGYPIGIDDPAGELGVNAVLFRARRPFHPVRLHEALEDLTAEALRGRGQLWIASQSGIAIGWESAGGGLHLGSLGPWLDAEPDSRRHEAGDMRLLAAELDWDPYFGDRRTVLAFIGFHLDADGLRARLAGCLLTDDELADGFEAWAGLPDPFAGLFGPAEDSSTATVLEGPA